MKNVQLGNCNALEKSGVLVNKYKIKDEVKYKKVSKSSDNYTERRLNKENKRILEVKINGENSKESSVCKLNKNYKKIKRVVTKNYVKKPEKNAGNKCDGIINSYNSKSIRDKQNLNIMTRKRYITSNNYSSKLKGLSESMTTRYNDCSKVNNRTNNIYGTPNTTLRREEGFIQLF